jgi:hypothetical protein
VFLSAHHAVRDEQVHFLGRYGDEATLFRLASQLETARPWPSRMPPITAGTGTSGMTQVPD